jgi:hypothetical protein
VQSARNLISIKTKLDNRDFATPVLFMRAKDGVILDLHETIGPSVPPKPERPAEMSEEATIPFYKRYEKLIVAALLMIVLATAALTYLLPADDVQISGTVRDWTGNPIKNADVMVLPAGASIRTDSNGYFILSGIPSKNMDRLQIRKDVTNEVIEVPISADDKKNKSIIMKDIIFKPMPIRLYGDIRDYAGDPTGAAARITIKSGGTYLTNLTDMEFGKYETNIFSNATSITAYDTNGEIIYTSPLRFTDEEMQIREKKFSIRFPSRTEIDIAGKVFNIYDNEALANTTVKIGPASDRTNDSGYYNLYGVPRSSQYYQVSKEGQIIVTKNLSDRYIDWTKPNWIYYQNASLLIPIAQADGG